MQGLPEGEADAFIHEDRQIAAPLRSIPEEAGNAGQQVPLPVAPAFLAAELRLQKLAGCPVEGHDVEPAVVAAKLVAHGPADGEAGRGDEVLRLMSTAGPQG